MRPITKEGLIQLGFYRTVLDDNQVYVKDVGKVCIVVMAERLDDVYLARGDDNDFDVSWIDLPIKSLDGIMALIDLLTSGK